MPKLNIYLSEIESITGFIFKIVRLNAPNTLGHNDKRQIASELKLMLLPLVEVITLQEASRVCARYTYTEVKALGWRKRHRRKKKGKGKVFWHNIHEKLSERI